MRDVIVYPSIDPQDGFEELLISLQGEIASFYRGQGSDFYRIRPYEVLESAHHVDWKATLTPVICRSANLHGNANRP